MLLLDTCTLLWLAGDKDKLSDTARSTIAQNAGKLFVSAISAFEIGVKFRKGKLGLPMNPDDWYAKAIELLGLKEIPVDGMTAIRSTMLPEVHWDPADRIIVATAQLRGMPVLTPDTRIASYPDTSTIW